MCVYTQLFFAWWSQVGQSPLPCANIRARPSSLEHSADRLRHGRVTMPVPIRRLWVKGRGAGEAHVGRTTLPGPAHEAVVVDKRTAVAAAGSMHLRIHRPRRLSGGEIGQGCQAGTLTTETECGLPLSAIGEGSYCATTTNFRKFEYFKLLLMGQKSHSLWGFMKRVMK